MYVRRIQGYGWAPGQQGPTTAVYVLCGLDGRYDTRSKVYELSAFIGKCYMNVFNWRCYLDVFN